MKLIDITEQLQRRKSPEELAAMKAAPDYWKVGARKEFNDIIKKYGAISRETGGGSSEARTPNFHRTITVLVSGDNSLTLHRDKRAQMLLTAIAKWLKSKVDAGYYVTVGHWGYPTVQSSNHLKKTDSLEEIVRQIHEAVRIDQVIDWLHKLRNSEKTPIKFDLRMSVSQPKPAVE